MENNSCPTDVGLEYVTSLGIRPGDNILDLEGKLIRAGGKPTAQRILREIDRRADHKGNRSGFYALKNQNLRISLALTGAFDGDILRKACNWVIDHREQFGSTILEVGCDCGVMSCFLAKSFPDATIVSIDRCRPAIANAKKLAKRMGLTNVTFKALDLKDVDGTYETVFSMRTVHENYSAPEDGLNDLSEQAEIFANSLVEYAHNLKSRIAEEGQLISIERIGRNALLLGWMQALSQAGLVFDVSAYDELTCSELQRESVFQAFTAFKGRMEGISPKELFDFACSKYLDYSAPKYEGWDAKIVYEYRRGELIEGYYYEYPAQQTRGKICAWTHRTDETGLIFYQSSCQGCKGTDLLMFYDISQKDELLQQIHNAIDEAKAAGAVVTKMT